METGASWRHRPPSDRIREADIVPSGGFGQVLGGLSACSCCSVHDPVWWLGPRVASADLGRIFSSESTTSSTKSPGLYPSRVGSRFLSLSLVAPPACRR